MSSLLATESGLWEPRRLVTGQSPYLRHLWSPVARSEKNEQTRVSRARGFRAGIRSRGAWVPLGVGVRVFQGLPLDHSSLSARRLQCSFGPCVAAILSLSTSKSAFTRKS